MQKQSQSNFSILALGKRILNTAVVTSKVEAYNKGASIVCIKFLQSNTSLCKILKSFKSVPNSYELVPIDEIIRVYHLKITDSDIHPLGKSVNYSVGRSPRLNEKFGLSARF